MPILFAALPIFSTLIGGYVVYRWKRDLHPWLSLSGGLLLGVAFLDLLPEALERGQADGLSINTLLTGTLLAILGFHLLDKAFSVHAPHEHAHNEPGEHCDNERHAKSPAIARAVGMIVHSFFDGLAIGGGFVVNPSLGMVVTLAVVTHDFSDGMSTVTILKNALGSKNRAILPMLGLDALAPFIGAMVGSIVAPREGFIAIMLAVFSGFFIFLSLSELLPQAHAGKLSRRKGVLLTIIGIALVFFFRSFANI
jgi:ZIP family zinc transporter